MATLEKNDYHCSQAELYATLRLLIKNYKDNLVKFTAMKAKYTLAFGNAIGTAIDAAEAMLSQEARDVVAENLRLELVPLNKKCGDNWQFLKSYIVEVFPGDAEKPNLKAAGSALYESSSKENWENTVKMNVDAKNFMAANSVKLLNAGNNMPAGFEAAYNADALAYFNKYNSYIAATETTTATTNKIKANNAVYKSGTDICADGQTLGRSDAAFAKLFTWSEILKVITPPGVTSLNISCVMDETGEPAVGVAIIAQQAGDPVFKNGVSDDGGEVLFANINNGDWKVLGKLAGRQDAGAVKNVTAGVTARLELRFKI